MVMTQSLILNKNNEKIKIHAYHWLIISQYFISVTFVDNFFEISKALTFSSSYTKVKYFYVDETDAGELMKTGIDAMLESLTLILPTFQNLTRKILNL